MIRVLVIFIFIIPIPELFSADEDFSPLITHAMKKLTNLENLHRTQSEIEEKSSEDISHIKNEISEIISACDENEAIKKWIRCFPRDFPWIYEHHGDVKRLIDNSLRDFISPLIEDKVNENVGEGCSFGESKKFLDIPSTSSDDSSSGENIGRGSSRVMHNICTMAQKPAELEFVSLSARFSFNPEEKSIAELPYLSRNPHEVSDTYGNKRVGYEGVLFGKDMLLLEYSTVGGGQCGYAAVFQALLESWTPTAEPYVDIFDETSTHPYVLFLKKLSGALNLSYFELITSPAEIIPFVSNETFDHIERALLKMFPDNPYQICIWLKEKNGIMLNKPPQDYKGNEIFIHVMLGNDPKTGQSDGHFSLLVPADDLKLQVGAMHHEHYTKNIPSYS